ncbi:DUF4429 domain-containing protein [Actinomadura flavalba]|uniref:DUF4429 domain-containing protein n=1 Tax=Actinomadura flavalba TaxID=1120938 RepID=UPI000381314B|nr:DUF4429 domain-containing protein [Actinomadura flavalba]
MAEISTKSGSWTFDGEVLRIVPGSDRSVHKLRKALGEVVVPVRAIAGVAYEPAKRGGRMRLRTRDGADPLSHVVAGRLTGDADPYALDVPRDRSGAGEYFADEVRNFRTVWEVPDGPADRYLLTGPGVPITAAAGDGTASFDGQHVTFQWNWLAEDVKSDAGAQRFALDEIASVEWAPQSGMGYGYLRVWLRGDRNPPQSAEKDPRCVSWGMVKEGGTMVLLGAAVAARLPHPSGPPKEIEAPAAPEPAPDATDAILRRLRELGELRDTGVLTEDEFATAKQALLRRLTGDAPG